MRGATSAIWVALSPVAGVGPMGVSSPAPAAEVTIQRCDGF